jgi:Dolichyl-phosphate-mannose-protein mannosyltransferase
MTIDPLTAPPVAAPSPRFVLTARELVGVFVLALSIRLVVVLVLGPRTGVDSIEYLAWAHSLAADGLRALPVLRIEHAPLYGLFLAAGLVVPGLDLSWFAVLGQSALGALTAVILARLTARETQCRRAGLLAGAVTAVQLSFVFWTAYVLSDTLFLLLLAICADRALQLTTTSHPARSALVVGALTVLAIAARPTGLALCLAVLPVLFIAGRHRAARLASLLVGYSLPFVLCGAVLVLGSAVAGSTLAAAGTARLSDWARSGVINGLLWTESGRATSGVDLDVLPPPVVNSLPAAQRDEFLQDGPLAFAADHPEFVAEQTARKLRAFWAPALPEYSMPHALAAGLYFVLFDLLAIIGLVQARRNTALVSLIGVGVAVFTLTSLVTIVDYDLRYRLPAELLLVPAVGIGLAWLSHQLDILCHQWQPGRGPQKQARPAR